MNRPVDWLSWLSGFLVGTLFGATNYRRVLLGINRGFDAIDVLVKGSRRS